MLKPIHQDSIAYEEICAVCPLPPKLIGEQVFMTSFSPDYTDILLKYATDETVVLGLGNALYRAHTRASEEKILTERGCTLDDGFNFMLWDRHDFQVIGTASLVDINIACRNALLGINIGDEKYRHGGRGTEAIKLLLDFAFYTLGFHNVGLYAFEYNTEAIECYRKLGFTECGRTRETRWAQGKYWDAIYMDMLDREWFSKRDLSLSTTTKPPMMIIGQWQDAVHETRYASRAIIVENGKLLMMHETVSGQWMLPGGGREEGETPEECCLREAMEETGFVVKVKEHFLVLDEYYKSRRYLSDYFICDIIEKQETHLTEEETELGTVSQWVPLDEALSIFSRWKGMDPDTMGYGLFLREYTALNEYMSTMRE